MMLKMPTTQQVQADEDLHKRKAMRFGTQS
jgi:hypothetical protein